MTGEIIRDRLTAILVVTAVVTFGGAAARFMLRSSAAPEGPRRIDEWRSLAAGGHVLGSRSARLPIVFFVDYECDVCAIMHQQLADFRELHGDAVSVVVRYYPLKNVHRHATASAIAAECAADQNRFSQMNDVLYQHQASFGSVEWTALAQLAGVEDLMQFDVCMQSPATIERVESDRLRAVELRLQGTPALIVDGRLFYGPDAIDFAEGILSSTP